MSIFYEFFVWSWYYTVNKLRKYLLLDIMQQKKGFEEIFVEPETQANST